MELQTIYKLYTTFDCIFQQMPIVYNTLTCPFHIASAVWESYQVSSHLPCLTKENQSGSLLSWTPNFALPPVVDGDSCRPNTAHQSPAVQHIPAHPSPALWENSLCYGGLLGYTGPD